MSKGLRNSLRDSNSLLKLELEVLRSVRRHEYLPVSASANIGPEPVDTHNHRLLPIWETSHDHVVRAQLLRQLSERAREGSLDLPVELAWLPAVKANLEVTLRLATVVADFELPDTTEPAPVYKV